MAEHDPARFEGLATRGYRISGVFLDDAPLRAVLACMRGQRWIAVPRVVFP